MIVLEILSVVIRRVFLIGKAFLALLLSLQSLLVFLGKHFPRWASCDPTLELTLILRMSVISNVTELHRDFLVRFQKQRNRDGQQAEVKKEDKDNRPGIVEPLVDWVV